MPLACGASEQNWPSPAGRPPRLFLKTGLEALESFLPLPPRGRPAFPASHALCFQARRKLLQVVFSQGPCP